MPLAMLSFKFLSCWVKETRKLITKIESTVKIAVFFIRMVLKSWTSNIANDEQKQIPVALTGKEKAANNAASSVHIAIFSNCLPLLSQNFLSYQIRPSSFSH